MTEMGTGWGDMLQMNLWLLDVPLGLHSWESSCLSLARAERVILASRLLALSSNSAHSLSCMAPVSHLTSPGSAP